MAMESHSCPHGWGAETVKYSCTQPHAAICLHTVTSTVDIDLQGTTPSLCSFVRNSGLEPNCHMTGLWALAQEMDTSCHRGTEIGGAQR